MLKKFLLAIVAALAIAAPLTVATAPAQASPYSQQQAVGAANDYLRVMPFSKQGLIDQLSSPYGSDFSVADATYAVNHIKVNWFTQAVRSAKSYLKVMHFSRKGLIHQLESPYGAQFTHAQAVYGVNHVGL
jgi:hypothetical protein